MMARLVVLGGVVGTLVLAIISQDASVLSFEGTSVFRLSNFAPTSAFSFSATEAADVLPEPGSMVLLGAGLLGLGAAVRRKWAQKA